MQRCGGGMGGHRKQYDGGFGRVRTDNGDTPVIETSGTCSAHRLHGRPQIAAIEITPSPAPNRGAIRRKRGENVKEPRHATLPPGPIGSLQSIIADPDASS